MTWKHLNKSISVFNSSIINFILRIKKNFFLVIGAIMRLYQTKFRICDYITSKSFSIVQSLRQRYNCVILAPNESKHRLNSIPLHWKADNISFSTINKWMIWLKPSWIHQLANNKYIIHRKSNVNTKTVLSTQFSIDLCCVGGLTSSIIRQK